MKTKLRKFFAMLLVLSMLASLLSVGAYAEGEDQSSDPETEQGEGGGEPGGEPGGEGGGGGSAGVDLTGMLSLKQYVFVASQGEIKDGAVSTPIYGVYEAGETVSFQPAAYDGGVEVYADSELTEPAEVEASIAEGVLTLSGVAQEGNVAYYLTTDEGAYTTTIYVVNDEYDKDTATLTLADGTTIDLTTYAPNMANGDYTATTEAIEGESVYIGGNRTAVSVSDFTDPENFAGYEDAAAWYISSGITNSGETLTAFGDTLYGFEYTVGIYRLFQLVNEEMTFAKDFVDASDYVGGMGSNDQFSDAVSATLQSGIWNGIFTQKTDTLLPGSSIENPSWLLTNIEGVTELGVKNPVTAEFAYVGIYNAFQSGWSMLNEDGEEVAEELEQAAAIATAETFQDAYTSPSWSWAAGHIGKSHAADVMNGVEEGVFAAENVLTRAEMAQILYAISGKPEVETTTNTFADLTQDWYKPAIEWCYANGVVAGRDAKTFDPSAPITRQEIAQMLKNYCDFAGIELPDVGDLTQFPDGSKTANWAIEAMKWAVGNGLINGGDGKLMPLDNTTRAMAAAIMSTIIDKIPYDYSNAAKISAVSSALLKEESAPAADKALTKAEAVAVLYAASPYVTAKTVADEDFAEQTGSENSNMTSLYEAAYSDVESASAALNGKANYAEDTGIALIDLGGTLKLTNATFGNVGSGSLALANATSPDTALDGMEAAVPGAAPTAEDGSYLGLVYNATFRNAFYREAIGSGIAILGDTTKVEMTSNNGTLVLDGSSGSMAGTAYVGFGGSLKVSNAVAYSSSQHLTNNLYNGTIHYVDSAAIGSGRVYSSDFWGGYQVYEDSIANGGNVTDEPTTLVVKNSVYGNSVGGNGFASQYFENSILNVSTANFQNTTSLVTDAGALTVVNSVMNVGSGTLVRATKAEDLIVTLVDSTVNLDGSCLVETADIWADGGMSGTGLNSKTVGELGFNSDVVLKFYGDVTLNVTGKLTVNVAEGANLTIYSANLTEADITNEGAGTLKVVTDEKYGVVTVNAPEVEPDEPGNSVIAPEAGNVGEYAGVVITDGSRDTEKEYTEGVTVEGTITDESFSGSIDTDSYYATGIMVSGSEYAVSDSTIDMGTSPEDNNSIPEGGTPEIGAGAGIAVRNGSTVTISGSSIATSGAWANMDYPRAGVVVGWQSQDNGDVVVMRNTTITNDGDDENTSNVGYFPGMPGVPLNIMKNLTVSGQGRAYVALGDAVSYLYNDDIEGTGWAAICTDMATAKGLYVYALGTSGVTTTGGYGVYSDTNCYDYFFACTLQGADFGAIISNNGLLVMGSAEGADEATLAYATEEDIALAAEKDSVLAGGRNAVMTHATNDPTSEDYIGVIELCNTTLVTSLDIKGTTEEQAYLEGFENFFELCDGAAVLIKSSTEKVDLVDCTLDSYNNILIEAVVDSDNGGVAEDAVAPANEIYLENVTSESGVMNIYNYDFQRGMNIEIAAMDLVGEIDYATVEEFNEMGYLDGIIEVPNTTFNGGVALTIDKGASWTPTSTSYLTSLTVNGVLNASSVTVNGQKVILELGKTYTGEIVITPWIPAN